MRLVRFPLILLAIPVLAAPPSGVIEGVVRGRDGLPVGGASVVTHASAVTTDPQGRYRIEDVRPGVHLVSATATGFRQTPPLAVDVRPGERAEAAFDLEPVDPLLTSLPLLDRRAMPLGALTPGVTPDAANGIRLRFADATIDGATVAMIGSRPGTTEVVYQPNSDGVAGFRIHAGGPAVVTHLESGANRIHGKAFYFHRNSLFHANDPFARRAGLAPADFHHHIYGGNAGGPLLGKRTFGFAAFERAAGETPITRLARIPTLAERRGDFAETTSVIHDPFQSARLPFAANRIPVSLVSPVAVRALSYYPRPSTATGPLNFTAQGLDERASRQIDVKINHASGARSRWDGHYSQARAADTPANLWGNPADPFAPGDALSTSHSGALHFTHAATPARIVEARASAMRFDFNRTPASLGFPPTQLGLPAILLSSGWELFPRFAPEGYQPLGAPEAALRRRAGDVSSLSASLLDLRGKHSVRTGAEFRHDRLNAFEPAFPQGSFQFSRLTTSRSPWQGDDRQGDSIASMLLGWGSGGTYSLEAPSSTASSSAAFYAQDDWRVSPSLAVNLGLRYSLDIPLTERYNRLSWFDTELRAAGSEARRPVDFDRNNLQPRAGLAWRRGRLVLRAAYSVHFAVSRAAVDHRLGAGFRTLARPEFSRDGGVTPYATLQNPYPDGLRQPGPDIEAGARSNANPRIQVWTAAVSRPLPRGATLEVAYAGSAGSGLFTAGMENRNALDSRFWSLGRAQLHAGERHRQLRPFPAYLTIDSLFTGGSSRYHALQARIEQRLSHRWTVTAHYTWSKLTDSVAGAAQSYGRLDLERAVSPVDSAHRGVLAFDYELPVWRGLFLSGLTALGSGFPIAPALDAGVLWDGKQRPDLDGATLSRPAPDTFGTAPRTLRLRGPALVSSDLALRKRLAFLELRAEAYNWLNHPVFAAPDYTYGAATFGETSALTVPARRLQLALRILF